MSMFCYQCQEAAGNVACTVKGVCGKKDVTANLEDLIIFICKGIAFNVNKIKEFQLEYDLKETKDYLFDAIFSTITNANFDDIALGRKIKHGLIIKDKLYKILKENSYDFINSPDCSTWNTENDIEIERKAQYVGVLETEDEDIKSLRELVTYGLKGMVAYTAHADNLGYFNVELYDFIIDCLLKLTDDSLTVPDLVDLTLKTGKAGVDAMALLDKANTSSYGNPEITEVNLGVGKNPGILITGHDLKDMEILLKQAKDSGVDIYTHSEMLPAHYYPEFKKYDNFVGNYGNAWWDQYKDFAQFNGPVLFTTNCIVPPKDDAVYNDKIFTTGSSGMTGWKHIEEDENGNKDFSPIIEMAKKCKAPNEIETGKIVGGFAHNQVFALADKVVDAVKNGSIKKFVVMAGCDGRMKDREYYTEFASALPDNTVILTAGCAKYRYNKLNLGDIGGIPRVLDAGQCNDSYSLAVIALKLKEIFNVESINDLPIVYNIAWYEQKAVIVLLALLYLGVKNITLGPTLPAFLSPNVANVLVENFGIKGISNVEDDLNRMIQ